MMLNNMYKSKQSESPSLEEGGERLSLLELNALVRRSLEQCLPDEYWIQAELSDVRSNTTGHCYLEFVQKDPRSNNLVAKARGMIWNNIYRLLKPYFEETTGQLFTSGIKVLVKVTVQFHELYGYSLTVLDIDPAYTLGDMARRRREILLQLEEEGVLTLNKELEIPILPQRIAVISSATAAGYGDFCHQLQHNPGGFFFYTELFPALMQGNQVEESVKEDWQADVMELQEEIIYDRNEEMKGRELYVFIEGQVEDDNAYVGRTYRDAPDIDGYIFINTDETLMTGDIVKVKVTGAYEYDLIGEICQ